MIVIRVRYQRIRLASLCWQAGSDAQSLSRGTGEGADQHGTACPQAGRVPAIGGEISADLNVVSLNLAFRMVRDLPSPCCLGLCSLDFGRF